MKNLAKLVIVIVAAFAVAACSDWWEDSPTAPDPKVPFGQPVAVWDTGIGDVFVYVTGGRVWTGATEAEFQASLDALLFRITQLVGPQEVAKLSLAGTNVVLKDSRESTRYDEDESAFWVGDSSEFQRLALEYFCDESKNGTICNLR